LNLPAWLDPGHVPFEAIPRERRSKERSMSDRVFWVGEKAAGLRFKGSDLAWTREELRAVQVVKGTEGAGWNEVRLLWSGEPGWATLLAHEPYDAAVHARFEELARRWAKLLDVPVA
jgi:hypothetical protein